MKNRMMPMNIYPRSPNKPEPTFTPGHLPSRVDDAPELNLYRRCDLCRCYILQSGDFNLCLGCVTDNALAITEKSKSNSTKRQHYVKTDTKHASYYTVIRSQKKRTEAQKQAFLKAQTTRWPKLTLQERFWKHVNKTENCWLWTAYCIPQGYGVFNVHKGKWQYAHRIAYQFIKGFIPLDKEVMHSCHIRKCVNPNHLKLGTHLENMRDRRKKLPCWI